MQERFAALGIAGVERFAAVDGREVVVPAGWIDSRLTDSPAAYGCLQSHLALVRRARAEGWPNLLILEDDVVFAPGFQEKFARYCRQVPAHWDMLYLGASHLGEPVRPGGNLLRLTRSLSTFAYALKHTVYDENIAVNQQGLQPVDVNNHMLQARFHCYSFHPPLAWVEKDYSDISGNTRDFWWLREALIMEGEELKAALKETLLVLPLWQGWTGESGPMAVPPTLQHYLRALPTLEVVLVDTGRAPRPLPRPLPDRCHYLFAGPGPSGSRGRAYNAAFREFCTRKRFFIFQEGDIYMHRNELSANLLMALQHDFVASYSHLYEVDEAQSQTLLTSGGWTNNGLSLPPEHVCGQSCIITRQGCELAGEWPEAGASDEAIHSQRIVARLRVFVSPGQAFRIHAGAQHSRACT